ncbi:TPA: ECs1072 family phage-associated protein [Raoultella planticola]
MDLNVTKVLQCIDSITQQIANHHGLIYPYQRNIEDLITRQALVVIKLDLILTEYRNNIDKSGFLLYGKNALYHYLFTQKNISIKDSKEMDFQTVLLVMWDDICNYSFPANVDAQIKKFFPLSDLDFARLLRSSPQYQCIPPDVWMPELADKLLS